MQDTPQSSNDDFVKVGQGFLEPDDVDMSNLSLTQDAEHVPENMNEDCIDASLHLNSGERQVRFALVKESMTIACQAHHCAINVVPCTFILLAML